MVEKKKETLSMVFYALYFSVLFQVCSSSAPRQLHYSKKMQTQLPNDFGSSVVFPVFGNVYPDGFFYADVHIGFPSRRYFLDIDTGSDLTWVQCAVGDHPKFLRAPHHPYHSPIHAVVECENPLCAFVQHPQDHPCLAANDQCYYNVTYADRGLSLGMLIKDSFYLPLAHKTLRTPLIFGCGYHQEHPNPTPYVDGVLGLANGKTGILSQLREEGHTQNVIGHCLNGEGLGYIFFGYDLVPPSGIVWTQMLHNSLGYYKLGPADLFVRQNLGPTATDLELVIDSGSTYTYFQSEVYEATLAEVMGELQGKHLVRVTDHSLPVCWRGQTPFQSINQVRYYFNTLLLVFPHANYARFELPPEAYLIVTSSGNVCLGILNSATEEGLGNLNMIGDISLQHKLVIYDNERQMIGWAPSRCDKLPKS
ncbi:hypothetical protein F0562_002836 [Nyssa sinensis]|uniref:Peptidase A1 domain-containing protein n=1 Tax=Nyssa sinensis TaxID=561372 RepID=A0A5J5BTU1_9ASTE|nr:hypothetical protein F0562_002836 [Nyssa sinensis]